MSERNDLRTRLAGAVLNNGLRSVRDASAYTSGVDESYLIETAADIADALLPVVEAAVTAARCAAYTDETDQ